MSSRDALRHLAVARWRARLRAAREAAGGRFFAPVLTLVTGTAAAQALGVAVRPLLTRLYTPEDFGVLTLFVTLLALYTAVGTGRFEDALMLPARRADAARLLALALGVAAASALALALVLPWRAAVARWLGSPALSPTLVLLPAAGLAAAVGQALETWHTRLDRFGRVAAGRTAQGFVAAAVQLAGGLAGAGALGLAGGAAAGFAALALVVSAPLLRRDGRVVRAALRAPGAAGALARRYRRFPLFTGPAALLNLLGGRVPVLGLAVLFGPGPTGLFGLAFGLLALPVGVVTGAVGQVFFARAAAARRTGTLGALALGIHRRLAALAVFPLGAVALAGPDAFALVFGEPWREAGVFARLLAPWLLLSALTVPLTRIFDVLERQRADLAFGALQAAGLLAALTVAARSGDTRIAVAAVAGVGTVLRVLQLGWLLRAAGAPLTSAAADLGRAIVFAAPFLAAGALLGRLTGSPVALLSALVVAAPGYYALTLRGGQQPGSAGDGAAV